MVSGSTWMFSSTHHSKSYLLTDCESYHSFPDPSCICSSLPFQIFPLLFLSPMTFAISLHLPSFHSFLIFLSCSCQFQSSDMPPFLLLSLSCIIFFPSNIPMYFNLLIFLLLPVSLPSLSHGINSSVMKRGGAISSTAIDLFCIVPLSCLHSFFFAVAFYYFFLPFH